ncbi:MAG: hypothetical protein GY847_02610 [Proteobacteria bacterium]|nr:hypothetical protein [Pseudomonadota bacterium]
MRQTNPTAGPGGLAALFLISMASLALEVLQMRIFAYAIWHHVAFLVISVAILGFAAAGAVLSSFQRLRKADPLNSMAISGLLFSVSSILCVYIFTRYPIDIFAQVGLKEMVLAGLFYLIFAIPYFFAGYIIAIALSGGGRAAGFIYFINLLGSGLGCFLLFATLTPLGAQGSLFVNAALGGAAALFCARKMFLRLLSAVLIGTLLIATPFADRLLEFRLTPSKAITQAQTLVTSAEVVFSKWSPLCRIDVLEFPSRLGRWIFQDGDAPTPLPRTANLDSPGNFREIPFRFLDQPKVLIIGSGGGMGAKFALQSGAKEVTGVDINEVTLSLSKDPSFSATAKSFNEDNRLTLHEAEGRFFVRRSSDKYDLIQMTGVDTYTALASGAYVMSESYLYTSEAFHDYLDHITDKGMIYLARIAFPVPRETLRIVVMALKALKERGAKEPWRHIVVLKRGRKTFSRGIKFGFVLIKKKPFTAPELASLRKYSDTYGYVRNYFPDETGYLTENQVERIKALVKWIPSFRNYPIDEGVNPFHAFANALEQGTDSAFLKNYPYLVGPVHDDGPFFFNQHRLSSLWEWIAGGEDEHSLPSFTSWAADTSAFKTQPLGLILLFLALVQLSIMVALCIFLPLLLSRRNGIKGSGLYWAMGYFLCLGFGYIFIMISSMQRFGLILGHPTYAVSIVMALFLLSSGLGSWVSGRINLTRAPLLIGGVAVLLLLTTILFQGLLPSLTRWVLPMSFGFRVFVTFVVLGPMAFAMGMCFPTGIRLLAERNQAFIPWAYGVNGSASVLGSVLAVCLALALGFTNVHWIAASLYLLAALLMVGMVKGRASSN